MTDLEITKLCAEASEVWKTAHEWYPTMTLDPTFSGVEIRGDSVVLVPNNPFRQDPQIYDPFHDDAQAMWLVKNKLLEIVPHNDGDRIVFFVRKFATLANPNEWTENENLNRAICECVAKMQASK